MKSLFIAHHNTDDLDVSVLARELRIRGIPPWVDHERGFDLGVQQVDEARRIIREDCFGLLLYARRDDQGRCPALDCSDFIRAVELDEALQCKRADPGYVLFAVPRGMDFKDLKSRSLKAIGKDLKKKFFKGRKSIGIVTGASTPPYAIKEVIKRIKEDW